MFSCSLDLSDYREAVGRTVETISKALDQAVEHAAVEGAEEARHGKFKDKSGRLRSEITAYFLRSGQRSVTWEILSPMPYSRYIEEGTRPHRIYPKAAYGTMGPLRRGQSWRATGAGPHEHIVGRGQALRFMVGGVTIFAAYVDHPGTPAFGYMGAAYLQAERTLWRELEKLPRQLSRIWT